VRRRRRRARFVRRGRRSAHVRSLLPTQGVQGVQSAATKPAVRRRDDPDPMTWSKAGAAAVFAVRESDPHDPPTSRAGRLAARSFCARPQRGASDAVRATGLLSEGPVVRSISGRRSGPSPRRDRRPGDVSSSRRMRERRIARPRRRIQARSRDVCLAHRDGLEAESTAGASAFERAHARRNALGKDRIFLSWNAWDHSRTWCPSRPSLGPRRGPDSGHRRGPPQSALSVLMAPSLGPARTTSSTETTRGQRRRQPRRRRGASFDQRPGGQRSRSSSGARC
jgi:hypothetical protein